MKRSAVILGVLLVFVSTSLAGLYLMLSPSFLTVEMAQSVAQMTGKRLTFSASPRLTVWPEPGVIFKGVRLSDRQGTNAEPFADIEQMRVKISARALIGRRAEIEEIRLFNPKFNLILDEHGRSNWSMAPTGKDGTEAKSNASASAFKLPPIYVEGGTVSLVDQRSGRSFSFRRLDMVLRLASIEGPVDIKGSADWQHDRVSFSLFIKSPQLLAGKGSPLDLNVSGTWLNFAFSGRGVAEKEFDLAGTVEGGARSMRGLMRWVGIDIGEGRGFGSFHTTGALSLKGKTLNITKGQFRLDGMKAQGEASVNLAAEKPKLTARLNIDQLDLSQYFTRVAGSSVDTGEGIESWSGQPIDFSALNSVNARAVLRAERLTYGGASMANALIDATVDNGILTAKLQQIDMYGGKGQGQLVLNGAQKTPTVQLGFAGKGVDGLRLFKELWNFTRIEGQTELAVALAATGRSQREMVASLRGTAGIRFTDGAIKGINLAGMVESVAQKILLGWMLDASEASDFQLLKANFKISDGIAKSRDLELVGPRLRLKGDGLIDLLKREVDFKIESDLSANGKAVGFAVPIVVSGPWAKPKFYPDIAGALENPEAVYEALKTLVGRAKLDKIDDPASVNRENAGGVAGEALSDGAEQGKPTRAVDLIKKQLNTNTPELMNGFTSESPPEPVSSEQ